MYHLLLALIHGSTAMQDLRRVGHVWIAAGPVGIGLWMPTLQPLEHAGLKAGQIAGWREAVGLAVAAGYDLDLEPAQSGAEIQGESGEWLLWPRNPNVVPIPESVPYARTWTTDSIGASTITFTRLADAPKGEVLYPSRLECYVAFNTERAARRIEELVTA